MTEEHTIGSAWVGEIIQDKLREYQSLVGRLEYNAKQLSSFVRREGPIGLSDSEKQIDNLSLNIGELSRVHTMLGILVEIRDLLEHKGL